MGKNGGQSGKEVAGEWKSDSFGMAITLSLDGNTMAVGAANNHGGEISESGQVKIFKLED